MSLTVFLHLDCDRRLLPYVPLPYRDEVVKDKIRIVGAKTAEECDWECSAVSRATPLNLILEAAKDEDMAVLGGLRIFAASYSLWTHCVMLVDSRAFHACAPLLFFDYRDWHINSVTETDDGTLYKMTRRR